MTDLARNGSHDTPPPPDVAAAPSKQASADAEEAPSTGADTLLLNEMNDRIDRILGNTENLVNRSMTLLGFTLGLIGLVTTFGLPYLLDRLETVEDLPIVVLGTLLFYLFAIYSMFASLGVVLPSRIDTGGSVYQLYRRGGSEAEVLHTLLAEKIKQYHVGKVRQLETVSEYQRQVINIVFAIGMATVVPLYFVEDAGRSVPYSIFILMASYMVTWVGHRRVSRRDRRKLMGEAEEVLEHFRDTVRLEELQRTAWEAFWRYLRGEKEEEGSGEGTA